MILNDVPRSIAGLLLLASLSLAAGAEEPKKDPPSPWRDDIQAADHLLRNHKWKAGLKKARKLADEITRTAWYGTGLRADLRELAFLQAVAEANLGQPDDAVWHWHMAWNLDASIQDRDFAPYGKAGNVLLEAPLRAQGEVPYPFEARRPDLYTRVVRPRPKEEMRTAVLENTAATRERPGDVFIEAIVDKQGRLHQPVVISDHHHPIVIYGVLRWLKEFPPLAPALVGGEPSDFVETFTIDFKIERW